MDNEQLNILRFLIEHQEEQFSIRQIAIKRKINYKSAYLALRKLELQGIIGLKKYGNITLCRFNRYFNAAVFLVEYERLQELLKNKNFKVIYERLKGRDLQFILLLFGSYAKGLQTKHSDIDLLLICDNPIEIEKQLRLIPLEIHLTSITYADFRTMLKTTEFTVVSEASKRNIILFGIEAYYRILNNA